MTKQFPNTDFTDWMDGFKILQSVTKNINNPKDSRTRSSDKTYSQWSSWNASTGFACRDVQNLLNAVKVSYQKETNKDEYIMLMPAFKKWMGTSGSMDGVYVLVKDESSGSRASIEANGKQMRAVKVFATLQELINRQEERRPTKKSAPPIMDTESITIKKCQLEALVKKIVTEELNARSNSQRSLWNMDQFQGGMDS